MSKGMFRVAAAALCLLALLLVWLKPHRLKAADRKPPPAAPLTALWQRTVPDFRGAALSPQGGLVALCRGPKGDISLWQWRSKPSHPLWVHKATNASAVAVSATGSFVVAWSPLDPAQPDFIILRGADGGTLSHRTLDGAVWNAELSPDGIYAGVVTGGKTLYLYTLSDRPYRKKDKRVQPWSLGGIGSSVAFATIGSYLVTGAWDDSSVSCYTPSGNRLWQYPENPEVRQRLSDRLFTAQLSGDGRYVLGVSHGNVRDNDPTLYLWRSDGGGTPQWTIPLGDDAFFPQAQITQHGRFVAVSYLRQIVRGDQTLSERRLRLINRQGDTLWERGGLLFSPTLIALAPDGSHLIVSDGQKTLYALSQDGRILNTYPQNGLIRQTALSADGQTLLVYTGDGVLHLWKLG